MVELFILALVIGAILLTHFVGVVAYKIKTHSKKSVWWIMDNEI